jgi:hypothetical protein
MSDRHRGFLEFLEEVTEPFGHFSVVARKQQESNPNDLPIIEVVADESDNEICLIRGASPDQEGAGLNLEAFHQSLRHKLEQYPDYSLMVSEWFQVDEEHTGRLDMPLDSVEIDENVKVLRLLF